LAALRHSVQALSLRLPSAHVCQSEQLGNGLNDVRLELPHQTLVGDPLAKRHDDDGWQDVGNGVAHLAEMLDVLSQHFAFALFDREEISPGPGLVERPRNVADELLLAVRPMS
jgi:hypothetical protein